MSIYFGSLENEVWPIRWAQKGARLYVVAERVRGGRRFWCSPVRLFADGGAKEVQRALDNIPKYKTWLGE